MWTGRGWGTIAKEGNTIAVLMVEVSEVGKYAIHVDKGEGRDGSRRKSHEEKGNRARRSGGP